METSVFTPTINTIVGYDVNNFLNAPLDDKKNGAQNAPAQKIGDYETGKDILDLTSQNTKAQNADKLKTFTATFLGLSAVVLGALATKKLAGGINKLAKRPPASPPVPPTPPIPPAPPAPPVIPPPVTP